MQNAPNEYPYLSQALNPSYTQFPQSSFPQKPPNPRYSSIERNRNSINSQISQNYTQNPNYSKIQKSRVTNYSYKNNDFNDNNNLLTKDTSNYDNVNYRILDLKNENKFLKKELHNLKKANAGWSGKKSKSSDGRKMNAILKENNELKLEIENLVRNLRIKENRIFEIEKNYNFLKKEKIDLEMSNINIQTLEKKSHFNIEKKYDNKIKNLYQIIQDLKTKEKNEILILKEEMDNFKNQTSLDKRNYFFENERILNKIKNENNIKLQKYKNEIQILKSNIKKNQFHKSSNNSIIHQNRIEELATENENLNLRIKKLEIENIQNQSKLSNDNNWKETPIKYYKKKLEERESENEKLKNYINDLKNENQKIKTKLNEKEILKNYNDGNLKNNRELDILKLEFENLQNENSLIKKHNENLKKVRFSENMVNVTENFVEVCESGLGKRDTEDLVLSFLLMRFENQRILKRF